MLACLKLGPTVTISWSRSSAKCALTKARLQGPKVHTNTDNTEFAQVLLDDLVVGEWYTLLVDLAVAAFVDEVANRFHARKSIGNVGFDDFEHLGGGFGELDEYAVVDLQQTEELHNLPGLRCHFIDLWMQFREGN